MTGLDDRRAPWKFAIAGFPGAGKTMLSSTATNPLLVFFTETPRIKSIASRRIEHVKLVNRVDAEGNLVLSVQDQLKSLITDLDVRFTLGEPVAWDLLVIDTGDELQQAMKEGRRIRNRGEWGVGDWVWLADAYRALMNSLIDLPMHVMVLFHMASSHDGDDGSMVRDVDLQGKNAGEWAGWFDVVAALDTFETTDEKGNSESKRVLLTHSSRLYPWVKDHSGNMPSRWELSDDFVGDFPRLLDLVMADLAGEITEDQKRQVVGSIGEVVVPGPGPATGATVPTPSELAAQKEQRATEPIASEPTETQGQQGEVEPEEVTQAAIDSTPEPEAGQAETLEAEATTEQGADVEPPEAPSAGPIQTELTKEPSNEEILQTTEELGAKFVCGWETEGKQCGEVIDDEDLIELAKIRFRQVYCRPHFKEALKKGAQ